MRSRRGWTAHAPKVYRDAQGPAAGRARPGLAPPDAAYATGAVYATDSASTSDSAHAVVRTGPASRLPGPEGAGPELADVGRLVRRGMRRLVAAARADERVTLARLLADHLGPLPEEAPVVEQTWPAYEHVNVQIGLEAWLAATGRQAQLVGVVGFQGTQFGLAELFEQVATPFAPRPGNVARVNLPCGPGGAVYPCVQCAIYLVVHDDRRLALLLRGPDEMEGRVILQAVAAEPRLAEQATAEIRAAAVEHNVFRGQVLSFAGEVFGPHRALLSFHDRPVLPESDLILPEATLQAVHRQVVGVAEHKDALLAAGQHLKRGLLLYGPPGVGKTHTVRHLTAALTGTTVILLTGTALHLISEACSVARTLQPAMLVVEDVDLIAEDRGAYPGEHPLLFQLLNEMDGLAEDADVVFVLTTNRPDLLEPALAARPGRVDQAVELMLPDAQARRALIDLYRGGLDLDTSRLDGVVERTEGVTASFLKELLRRAAVIAAATGEANGQQPSARLRVSADALDTALEDLLATHNAMTRVLLGG